MIVFLILYIILCLEWGNFCVAMQREVYGHKDGYLAICGLIFVNALIAPISIIFAISRIHKDFIKSKALAVDCATTQASIKK